MIGWYGRWHPMMWAGMGVVMLVFWGLIALAAITLWRATRGRRNSSTTGTQASNDRPNQALRILDERFAKGEISEEEYRQRRDVLLSR